MQIVVCIKSGQNWLNNDLLSIFTKFLSYSLPGKTKYRTVKDLYRNPEKNLSYFCKERKLSAVVNKLHFHSTDGSPSFPIWMQYSLAYLIFS